MSVIDVHEPAQSTAPHAPDRPHRRWSAVWLLLGAALLPFTLFQTVIPVAAWLAPIFLLRFVRTTRALIALPVVALVGYGATLVALRGFYGPPDVFVLALGGATLMLAYGVDKLAAGRVHGLARTLLFPAVDTAASFLFSLDQGSPLGSWGATGYTQVSNLPLLQTTSVLGVFGVSFLIMWAAPVVNELWERRAHPRAARSVVVPFVAVLLAALLFGGVRLALFAPSAPTVQMAALTPDRELDAARDAAGIRAARRTAAERGRLTEQYLAPVIDDLLARTRRAARAGARVVAWSEGAGTAFKEDERVVLDRAAAVAREEGIYLELGMVFVLPTPGFPRVENRSILIDPSGEIRWDYHKATLVPGDGNALGRGVLPVVDTPFGRLSVVICFDADFPWLVRQAGRADVDVLLAPSSDWGPVGPMHADMAVVRAVENGMSILRPARNGMSLAVDPQGRTLARADDRVSEDHTVMAVLPTAGGGALYPVVGDLVGWASVIGAVLGIGALGVRGLARRRRRMLA